MTILFATLIAKGQIFTGEQSNQIVKGSQKVKVDAATGCVEFFDFSSTSLKSGLNIDGNVIEKKIGLPDVFELEPVQNNFDSRGNKHTKYQLFYENIPVEGMGYTVHFKNGVPQHASGKVIKSSSASNKVSLSEKQAITKAVSSVNAKQYMWENDESLYPKAELLFVPKDSNLILCYRIDVYAQVPLCREYVYVNAQTGGVEKKISRIHQSNTEATAVTFYNGDVQITTSENGVAYTLKETTRGNGISTYNLENGQIYSEATEFVDQDNYWNEIADQVAYDAHFGAEKTYDYYYDKYGRNSIDDNGKELKSYVHFGVNYANAFWDGDRMTYGDGNGTTQTAMACLDIVAHEITHGLTSYSAGLEYADEPGALNESFSDIFAVAVDYFTHPTTANFLIGEQVYVDGVSYMRDLSSPNSKSMPDTYQGNYWATGDADYGGVHTNCSVQSYWFYLLCEGGNGVNDNGDSYMVEAIGMVAAEAIAYRNLTVYLNKYSNYEDARFYSIQAAEDLYGACSNEVIQVTNAWYAVGVGDPYQDAVVASFRANETFYCSAPASVALQSTSTNASSYAWYIDGQQFSTEENPTVAIDAVGGHDIMLMVEGVSVCNSTDVVIVEDFIQVENKDVPIDAAHTPGTLNSSTGGVYVFELGDIKSKTLGAEQGYADFTCPIRTELTEGNTYAVTITTGSDFAEGVKVWLDFNNDGEFSDADELLFSSIALQNHNGNIEIPAGQNFDVPLRLRVGSEKSEYVSGLDGASDSQYGQYEDYTVVLRQNTEAPQAVFTMSSDVVNLNESVTFTDKSTNLPTERIWYFEGGEPETSNELNPTVTYKNNGTFNVELTVTNAYGTSTITRQVEVISEFLMGAHSGSTLPSGIVLDSGGEENNYQDNEANSFVIQPDCAKEIVLTIESLVTESCCDGLKVYDGTSQSATLLEEIKGTISSKVLTASSGAMLLVFESDNSVNEEGFKASWNTIGYEGGEGVVADFSVLEEVLPVNFDLHFIDDSQHQAKFWNWNFGDGSGSEKQNPTHKYTVPGNYQVQLAVDNCVSADVINKEIVISPAPELSVAQDTIRIDLTSGEKVDSFISVNNLNEGLLAYEGELLAAYEKGNPQTAINYAFAPEFDGVKVGLAHNVNYYAGLKTVLGNIGAGYLYISLSNFDDNIDELDVLIIDDSCGFLDVKESKLKQWIENGGFLIIQGDGIVNRYNSFLEGTGIEYLSQAASGGVATLASHDITKNIGAYEIGAHADCTLNVILPAEALIYDNTGNCYAAVTDLGKGNIMTMGDESFQYMTKTGHEDLLVNAFKECLSKFKVEVCEIDQGYAFVAGVKEDSLDFVIDSRNLIEGEYVVEIQVKNNDVQVGEVKVPILLNVTGIENIETEVSLISYSNVLVDEVENYSLRIKNSGTRTLSISQFVSDLDVFKVTTEDRQIAPDEIKVFEIAFTPTDNRFYSGELEIHSSDPDSPIVTVQLQGNAIAPPVVENPIGNRELDLTGELQIDLNTVFSDADGDELSYEVSNSDENIGLAEIIDGVLYFSPLVTGEVTLTVTALDPYQASVNHTFIIEVKEGLTTKVKSAKDNLRLHLYPNPVKDWLYIKLSSAEKIKRLEIVSANGTVLRSTMVSSKEIQGIDVSNLAQGIYFVKVCFLFEGNNVEVC